jgi:hypothetical protein
MALPSSSGDLLWWVRSMELASIGGPGKREELSLET